MVLWANSKWRNTYFRKSWKVNKKLKTVVFEPGSLPLLTFPAQRGENSTPDSYSSEMQAPSSSWLPIRGLSSGRSRTLALLICPQSFIVEEKSQVNEWEVRAPSFPQHLTGNSTLSVACRDRCGPYCHCLCLWDGGSHMRYKLRRPQPAAPLPRTECLLPSGVTQREACHSLHIQPQSPDSKIFPGGRNMLWNR